MSHYSLQKNTKYSAHALAEQYRKRSLKRTWLVLLALLLLLALVLVDIVSGPAPLSIGETLQTIVAPSTASNKVRVIVWDLRLPIALMAVLIGAMLGAAGAQMQTILNNPLADPFTLGISSAASFGAALAITLQISLIPGYDAFWVSANAFVMSMLASLALFAFTKMRGVSTEIMVLVGIAMMFSFSALLSLLQYGASETELSQIVFWMMGSLARATWVKVFVCLVVLAVSIPFFISRSWALTALRMGDDKAAAMGVNIARLRLSILVFVSLLSAVAVSFVGVVGFVGLVGPHIARMLVGEDQRAFLPFSVLAGALLMSAASIATKNITLGIIYPIGVITSLIGIPFFISLIVARRKRQWQ